MAKNITKQRRIVSSMLALVFVVTLLILSSINNIPNNIALLESAFFSQTINSTTSGTTNENIILNFGVFDNLDVSDKQNLMSQSLAVFNSKKTDLIAEYNAQILTEPAEDQQFYAGKFSVNALIEGDQVIFRLTYTSQAAWQFFTAKSGYTYTPDIVYRLLDYSRYDRKEKIGSVSSIGGTEQYLADYIKVLAYDIVNTHDAELLNNLQVKSVYAYVTAYRRRHTNADVTSLFSNAYFHQWDTSSSENIAFFINYPRIEIWYILSLSLALTVIAVVMFISFINKDKEDQNTLKVKRIVLEPENEKEEIFEPAEKEEQIKKPKRKKQEDDKEPKTENKKRIETKDE